MFSPRLIKKKLEKATSGPATKKDAPAKRKRKNGKTALKTVTTKKQRLSSAKAATSPQDIAASTDINKNKVSRPAHTKTNTSADKNKETKIKKKKKQKNNTKTKSDKPTKRRKVPQTPDRLPRGANLLVYTDFGKSEGLQLWPNSESELNNTSHLRDTQSTPKEAMECSSDSDNSMTGRKHSKKDKDHCATESMLSPTQIGECLAVTTTQRGSVVAALTPENTLYLQGCVVVCPLLGSAEVLGYIIPQGQSQPLYSLPSCSLLGVTPLEVKKVDPSHASLQGLPSSWLENLVQKDTEIILLEVHRHTSPRVEILTSAGWGFLGSYWDWQKPWHSVGASVVTPHNCHKYRVTFTQQEWRDAAQTVVMNWNCGAVPRVVVGGGKGVGKSTFFKYLVNSLLSVQPNNGVLCLDFDPGQPELSLPTSLSLTHLTKPLLGPAYTHDLRNMSVHRRHILVGSVSPQFVLEEYVAAVQELCGEAGVVGEELPLLVNTMGWTQGTGLGLMLDILRLVQPTHVMQIQDHRDKRNYPFMLDGVTVASAMGGITTQAGDWDLHYTLTVLPRGGHPDSAPHMAQPAVLRELRVLAEAGQAADRGHRVTVPWAAVALHVCEEQVPRDRILQVLNGQLVALCHVDPGSLHTLHQNLPQLLAHSAGFGDLLGWAVVMGIDPLTSNLHLATLMPPQEVTEKVNALIMPRIHLPASFYKLFCLGTGPYLEEEKREGAGRLRIGRRIKPRGPKD